MVAFVLYAMEYHKLGDATESLKKFWLVALVSYSAGILITEWLIVFLLDLTLFKSYFSYSGMGLALLKWFMWSILHLWRYLVKQPLKSFMINGLC